MDHQQDLEHTAILNSRRFAPIPRRSRTVERKPDVDGSSVPAMDGPSPTLKTMAAQTYASANELAKAAEELLEHFDQATLKGDKGSSQGRVLAQGSDKANRRIVLDSGLHEDGSDSSAGGEVEIKISGLMTPEESSSSKNGLSEDGNMAVIADAYNTPRDWSTGRTQASSESASSTRREHDCEHDGCYGLTARFIDDDRLSDDYAARGGGKKRKVPASAQQGPTQSGERDETSCVHSCGHICNEATTSTILDTMNRRTHPDETSSADGSDSLHDQQSCPHVRCCDRHSSIRIVPDPIIRVPKRRMTAARTAIEFEKRLFHARKAQVLGLHADAVTCIGQSKQKNAPVVPSKGELEELVKALEYTGVTGWEGDRVGSGAGLWEGHVLRGRIKNGTLTGTSPLTTTSGSEPNQSEQPSIPQSPGKLKWRKQGRIAERHTWRNRKPVKRGGWIPEGTFEFEMPSTGKSAPAFCNPKLIPVASRIDRPEEHTQPKRPQGKGDSTIDADIVVAVHDVVLEWQTDTGTADQRGGFPKDDREYRRPVGSGQAGSPVCGTGYVVQPSPYSTNLVSTCGGRETGRSSRAETSIKQGPP